MGFFDKAINKDIDISRSSQLLDNPVVYGNYDTPDLIVLLEKPMSDKFYNYVNKLFTSELSLKLGINVKINFISVLPFTPKEKDLKSGVIKFYQKEKINLKKYIKPNSKVIATPRTLYSLTESDDLVVDGFYDFIFNDTWFYAPIIKSYIFTIDDFSTWLKKSEYGTYNALDIWQRYFTYKQLLFAYKFKPIYKRKPALNIITVEAPDKWIIDNTSYEGLLAWDIETKWKNPKIKGNGLDPWDPNSDIKCLTFSFDGITGYYLDYASIKDKSLLNNFFRNKKGILQNGKFDIKFMILKAGLDRECFTLYHDTWNGSHVVNEKQKSSLKSDTWLYTQFGGYDRELDRYKEKHPEAKTDYGKIPDDILISYATMDPIITFQTYLAQVKIMEKIDLDHPDEPSLKNYFYKYVMPSILPFMDIELHGWLVDWRQLDKLSDQISREINNVILELDTIYMVPKGSIKWSSDQELGILFDLLNYPDSERGKAKPRDSVVKKIASICNRPVKPIPKVLLTGEVSLNFWKHHGYEKEMTLLLHYRQLSTLFKTFIGDPLKQTGFYQYRKLDDRVHPSFGPMLTNSHRNWSRNPNGQNIPKKGDYAKLLRKIFKTPGPDYDFVEMDVAGFQLRIACILSGDKFMTKAFKELGGDLHSMTAQGVLRKDVTLEYFLEHKKEKEFKQVRNKAKGINFLLLFNGSGFNFAKTAISQEWTIEECNTYIVKNNLTDRIKFFTKLSQEKFKSDSAEAKEFPIFWTVANDIRKKHFETYTGLDKWAKDTIKKAEKNGYVRSVFGAIRRLPGLYHKGKHEFQSIIKNYQNVALNSPVQNYEVVLINKLIAVLSKYIKDNNLKSRIIGNVHDSIMVYVYKPESQQLYRQAKLIFEEARPENNDIPLVLEVESSDYYGKDQVWGFGEEIDVDMNF